ncbi:hypothetical protein CFIMG_005119RAa [Ceratocystis fimbriata CBS 114723]|uniref:Uncharacterized protein n=1 Tax=Ceratocystis fimbriata CBS 114723 TaxID=1035309 RepID=A0A2C5WVR1_9PEZI|nr:hypothetical protein CFIMG_005119RAa [Ceratocystis fimbriata CBS 114723]
MLENRSQESSINGPTQHSAQEAIPESTQKAALEPAIVVMDGFATAAAGASAIDISTHSDGEGAFLDAL